jgi:hypothetical protein
MSDKGTFKFACCPRCGALADVEATIIGLNERDVERCKNPPIQNCPDMKAAIKDAESEAPN